MPSYAQLLKSPHWQKKRLQIMERDGFKCRVCNSTETTLNVHHLFYDKGMKPWEYPDLALITLCEIHHTEEEKNKTQADWRLCEAFRRLGADNRALERIAMMAEDVARFGRTPGGALSQLEHELDAIWISETKGKA